MHHLDHCWNTVRMYWYKSARWACNTVVYDKSFVFALVLLRSETISRSMVLQNREVESLLGISPLSKYLTFPRGVLHHVSILGLVFFSLNSKLIDVYCEYCGILNLLSWIHRIAVVFLSEYFQQKNNSVQSFVFKQER